MQNPSIRSSQSRQLCSLALLLGLAFWMIAGSHLSLAESGTQLRSIIPGQTQSPSGVRDIIVVFKTHFDIGYTDMASNVVQKYRTTMIDKALAVVDQNRPLPPAQQFVWTIPGWPMSNRGDNHGPPTPEEVQQLLNEARQKLPQAKVRIGRLSDFADAILAEKVQLPVIRGDMPDTWIHGPMCDPDGAQSARTTRPLISVTESLHTLLGLWGINRPDPDPILAAGRFQRLEDSWAEHSSYIHHAGHSGSVKVTLPQELKVNKIQLVDLRGRPQGRPIPVKRNAFAFSLPANSPASFVLQPNRPSRTQPGFVP